MTALELLARLRDLEVRVTAVDGELELDAPGGVLSPELQAEIRAHKRDLLKLLAWTRRSQRSLTTRLQPVARDAPLPLSWAQQRLWFLDQLEPGTAAYNIAWTVRLRGALNRAALQTALQDVVQRHESLRTRFPGPDGVPQQEICRELQLKLEFANLAGAAAEKLRARLSAIAGRPFDLAQGPLLRTALLQLNESEHVLLVVTHHIVSDGASMRILFRELAAFYEARLAGDAAALPPLAVQYVDYAVWQRQWLDSDEIARQGHYWLQQLKGLPPLLELPWDRPRAAAQRFRGASVLRLLPPSLAGDLRALGRQQGCTLYMVMLAAFFVLLRRYSARDDLVVGTPMGGRSRTQLEGLIGFFINTVVLRADLAGNPAFSELLQQVRNTALDAHANQDMPFEKLVELLQPERELSYSPVFQVMFDLQEEPRWKLPVRDLEVIPEVIFSSRTASFDLTLSVRQAEHGLDAMFEYDTDLFDESSIERMAAHYESLLEATVRDVTMPILQLPLVAPDEQQRLEQLWNTASVAYPDNATLAQLFLQRVRLQPHAPALKYRDRTLSYAELDARAANLAGQLHACGLGHGTTVAVFTRRSAEGVCATLALLKAGACVMPLDPAWPDARSGRLLADAGADALLCAPELATRARAFANPERPLIVLDETAFAPGTRATPMEVSPTGPDDLAFLLYTSGTTGAPKGVELTHRGLVNYLHQLGRETIVSPHDRVLQFASPAFDIAIEEMLGALLHGALLVLRNETMTQSLPDFVAGCEREAISWLSLPTAWWHELCAGFERDNIRLPSALRCVVIGGEKAEQEALRKWRRHAGHIRLFNTYGPTETSVVASWCELTHGDAEAGADIPIGQPVPNVRIWVMDELRRPLPTGLPGELYIGGVGLARGYRNQPALDAERFCVYTAADGSRHRLYRTGDRGRYLPDGSIAFLGRTDSQIKLRGHRIEPAEVEASLGRLPGVDRCAVLLQGAGAAARLVGYFSGTAEASALRAQLRQELPDYMVPAVLLHLQQLPFTANGKLDRVALPPPAEHLAAVAASADLRGSVEQALAGIWSDVLGVPVQDRHASFFELGGHSLLATRVMARVRDLLHQAVPLRALFDQPTVAGLAAIVESGREMPAGLQLRRQRGADALQPLSWPQQRLWLVDRLQPGNPAYHLYSVNELRGLLRLDCLQQALDAVMARHDVLRTQFVEVNGEPMQLTVARVTTPFSVEQPASPDTAAIETRIGELLDAPFDLHQAPLLRVHALDLSAHEPDRCVLVLIMHHIVADGWSLGVIYRELAEAYAALNDGLPVQLPALPLQYADYAVWQRSWHESPEFLQQLRYWQQQLADVPPYLELPADMPRPAVQRFNGAWVSTVFEPALLQALQRLASAEKCTLFMVLLAAFKVLLARLTGQTDLVVGTQIAGRNYSALEPLIGCFLNTLVLRTGLGADPTLAEVLQAVRRTTLDAYDHPDVPFESLLEELQPLRNAAVTPLVQVMFNLHNQGNNGLQLEGVQASPWLLDRGAPKFDLVVVMAETVAGLRAGFEYNTDLYRHETVATWLQQFRLLLEALAHNPQQHAAHVRLADPPVYPRPTAASVWPVDRAVTDTVTARFAAVVRRFPERLAVSSADGVWTYTELNQRAHAVAQALLAAGVQSGGRVALLLGHDACMVAGILGVLKAGAAYVPLDPTVPAARLQQLCQVAGVAATLSDAQYAAIAVQLAEVSGPCLQVTQVLPAAVPSVPLPELLPDALAYILFTSGSTGVPKGVCQSHAHVLQHLDNYAASLGVEPTDRLSLLSGYGFDAAVMDIFGALLNGACLVPVDLRQHAPPEARTLLADVSVLHATPTVFRLLLEATPAAHVSLQARAVVLGGEVATADDFILFQRHFTPTAVFVNGYGPSECTLATQFMATSGSVLPGRRVPIGLPVPHTDIRLQDENGCNAAFAGEIVIRSPALALGYLDEPELTASRFVAAADASGIRSYRSGDLARRLPDGQLVYTGRRDAQLKLRGYRIEPAEIEHAIMAVPGVTAVAVLLRNERLTACHCGSADEADIRAHVRAVLPAYMQPENYHLLPALPLKANGKLDVAALPAVAAGSGRSSRPPGNATERAIALLWEQLLDCSGPGAEDDFFALGGHSLLATRMLARLRQDFGVVISLREFFTNSTIAELAVCLDASRPAADDGLLSHALPAGELPPLSWAQQRLWFLDQLEPGNPTYNLHWAARLSGALDRDCLERAIGDLVARHAALRTCFAMHGGEPAQLVIAAPECRLLAEALPGATPEQVRTRLLDLLRQPFDLSKAPLFRACLLQTATNEAVLLLVMHHIVSDGWSMGILFNELSHCYSAGLRGTEPALPPLPLEYGAFAAWQRTRLASAELQQQADYWRAQLAGVPPLLELPLDHERPPLQRNRGAWVTRQFSPAVLDSLRQVASDHGATLFMVLLAAFKVLLLRHTGREDLVVGAPVAGRRRSELEGIVGFFLNTLVLRTQVDRNLGFAALLERVKVTTLAAYDHQELPFEKLLEIVQPARSMAYSPLVQVSFNLHNEPGEKPALPGLNVDVLPLDRGTSKYDLAASLVESRHGLQVGFEYNTDIFAADTVAGLLQHFGELMTSVADDATVLIARMPLSMTAAPRLPAAAGRAPMRPEARTLATRFADIVARYPHRPAVQLRQAQLSYRELDERANAVAWLLLEHRRQPSALLGLLLGHDLNTVIGLLAAIKAGMPYVPIDASAPPARINDLLATAGVTAVLVDDALPAARHLESASLPRVVISQSVLCSPAAPDCTAQPDDLAYVLFTSGSTGTPKGVMQTHRNVLHHILTYSTGLNIGPEDRVSLLASYAFDAAVMDIFAALLNGACLYPLELRSEQYPGEMLDLMSAHKLTVLHATPTVFRYLMRSKVCRHELTAVRAVVLGGEEARAGDFELFRRQFAPPTLFINGFGPSESTLATQFVANHATRLPGRVVPIGAPVADMEIVLLDERGCECELMGELALRSPFVARGYWQAPELTAERFLAVPGQPESRLYRTGDHVRRLPDGQYVFLGRIDDQIKIRGHRVEPAEIEAALLRHAGVERATVLIRHGQQADAEGRLVAYVTGNDDIVAIRKSLKAALPDYMLPAVCVHLDEMPLMPNGKVDRNALPEPRFDDARESYVPPHTDTEKQLASIWADVLGVTQVGIHDDFFELGGHSLLAAQLAARINESMRVAVPLRRLFDAPTIAQVALHIETLHWALYADESAGGGA